jgi:hypothetical protein
MLSRSLGVYASLALVANSVLIPPNVAVEGLGDDNALETLAINPYKKTVTLECPGCTEAVKIADRLIWTETGDSTYLLDFEVGPNEDTLTIDGFQLYPPVFDHFLETFSVRQINPESSDSDHQALPLRVTGYTFHYDSAETITEAGTELLPMKFQITGVEMKGVNLPTLTINLLKDVEGRLMIASIQINKATVSSPKEQTKECEEWPLLCKWKSIFADKVDGFKKGCGKYKGDLAEAYKFHGKPPHHHEMGKPGFRHPHRPHGFHRPHGVHHSKTQRVLRRVFFTILLPILIGVFAGTLTYLIGMALGCAIAMIIAKVRGQSAYVSLPQDEENHDADEDEKDSEKEVYSELPLYEAPPVYEEAVEKEVVDETK